VKKGIQVSENRMTISRIEAGIILWQSY